MNRDQQKNREIFEDLPVPRALAAMAIPTIIAQLIILIYNMADTFFIGRVNNHLMVAGASLILPIFNLSIALANIAGTGGGTQIARLLGVGREDEARAVAAFSFWFSLAAGALFSLCTLLFIHPLLKLLGASAEAYPFARQYAMCVIVFGAIPTVMSVTLSNLLRNVGASKQAGFGVAMGGIINIVLDPLFMFVLLPPGHEMVGAGIATALSNCVNCLYFLLVIRKLNSPILRFSPKNLFPNRANLAAFFGVGLPAALSPFLFDMNGVVIDRLMSGYGDAALAALGIVLKAERLPLNIGVGLCLGMTPLAAYNFSSGNHARMEEIFRTTRRTGATIAVISIVLYEIFAPWLIRIFIADPATVAYGTSFLRVRALATVMMFMSFIYVYLFQAMGRGDYALGLAVLRWAVVNIPMLFLFNSLFGMYGLVWSQLAGDCIVVFVSGRICRAYFRRRGLDWSKI